MIELKNISLSYGGKAVFDNFSQAISCDGVTCLSGPSGCGKTTLLHMLASLVFPDSGTVSGLPKRPAVMFQEDRLLPWLSALKNVSSVSNEASALMFLDALELSQSAGLLPSSLSGGMRRRVSLARALAFDSDFLLLDEPFSGLDPAMTEKAAALILARGLPAVVVTHSAIEAKLLGGRAVILRALR